MKDVDAYLDIDETRHADGSWKQFAWTIIVIFGISAIVAGSFMTMLDWFSL